MSSTTSTALWTLLLVALAAPAAQARQEAPPEPSTGWFEVRSGLAFATVLSTDLLAQSETDGSAAPTFGVGLHWRLSRVDLGLQLDHLGGTTFTTFERRRRLRGQVRVAGMIRWRFVEEASIALYTRISPGWMGFTHSEGMRALVAEGAGEGVPTSAADPQTSGFAMGNAFGFLYYVNQTLSVWTEVEFLLAFTRVGAAGTDFPLVMNRTLVSAGVSWRL